MTKWQALGAIVSDVLKAYELHHSKNAIPDSDLDNEQPLALSVHTTLGVARALRRWYHDKPENR